MEKRARKKLVYPLVTGTILAIGFPVCFYALGMGVFYASCFALLGAGFGLVVSRVICHLYEADNAPKTWAINIYGLVAVGGWGGAVFCRSWLFCNVWLTVFCSGLILALGTRFLKDEDGNGIPDIFEKPKRTITREYLYDTLLFKVKGDRLGRMDKLALDQERPLIVVDGEPKTVNEARALGWNSAADEAVAYINSLYEDNNK